MCDAATRSYADAVSGPPKEEDLKKLVKDAACNMSKYMKVIMDKMMEYSNKTLKEELSKETKRREDAENEVTLWRKKLVALQMHLASKTFSDNQSRKFFGILKNGLSSRKIEKERAEVQSLQREVNSLMSGLSAAVADGTEVENLKDEIKRLREELAMSTTKTGMSTRRNLVPAELGMFLDYGYTVILPTRFLVF